MTTFYHFPTPGSPNETQQVTLSGTLYTLRWRWNERDARWFLDLSLSDGTPIVSGMRVVTGWDLLSSVPGTVRPPGAIIFYDITTPDTVLRGVDPGLDDFGDRVAGYYVVED